MGKRMNISKVIVRRYATGMRSSGNGGPVGWDVCVEWRDYISVCFFWLFFVFLPSMTFAKRLAVTRIFCLGLVHFWVADVDVVNRLLLGSVAVKGMCNLIARYRRHRIPLGIVGL